LSYRAERHCWTLDRKQNEETFHLFKVVRYFAGSDRPAELFWFSSARLKFRIR
jgi:hypothetical protein